MTGFIQVQTTVPDVASAVKISDELLAKKLSPCVQIIKVDSIYRWKGKTERKNEWLLLIKTREWFFKDIQRVIKSLHPYEVPEVISLPIMESSPDYLKWMDEETSK